MLLMNQNDYHLSRKGSGHSYTPFESYHHDPRQKQRSDRHDLTKERDRSDDYEQERRKNRSERHETATYGYNSHRNTHSSGSQSRTSQHHGRNYTANPEKKDRESSVSRASDKTVQVANPNLREPDSKKRQSPGPYPASNSSGEQENPHYSKRFQGENRNPLKMQTTYNSGTENEDPQTPKVELPKERRTVLLRKTSTQTGKIQEASSNIALDALFSHTSEKPYDFGTGGSTFNPTKVEYSWDQRTLPHNSSSTQKGKIQEKKESSLKKALDELQSQFSKNPSTSKPASLSLPINRPFDFGGSHDEYASEEEDAGFSLTQTFDAEAYKAELQAQTKLHTPEYKIEAFNLLGSCRPCREPEKVLSATYKSYQHLGKGSYHDAFRLSGTNEVYRFAQLNAEQISMKIHGPVGGSLTVSHPKMILYNGYLSYKKMEEVVENMDGVRVATLYNHPVKDGYWRIEYIPHAVNLHDESQLKRVGLCLQTMVRKNTIVFPDFRPGNVRADQNRNIVIIDFCEDKSIDHYRGVNVRQLVKGYIVEWAGGNETIRKKLTEIAFAKG